MSCTEYKPSDLPVNVNKYLLMWENANNAKMPKMTSADKNKKQNLADLLYLTSAMTFFFSIRDFEERPEEESLETTTEDTETTGDAADADL